MADIKQIKIGNTIYNIEPYTAYLPLTGGTIDAGGLKAPLILKGGASNWNEGLRIVPSGNWATIMLGGNDITETEGTSANSWSIHNNNGKFYISKNGSDYAPTKLSNTDGTWRVNDNTIIHSGNIGSQNVNYANSAGSANSVSWDNISSRPITITQRNNDSPVSGAYAYGTYVTMRNTNNWLEIYAPHMGTSSSRVYMQTGWDNDRQGWKAIAWTSDIPTSLPASDVYAWAKSPTKPSYTKSEVGLGNVDNTADANKNVNYANAAGSANYFNYGRGAILANSSSFTNNFCKDIFGEENNNNYHLVALRTNSQAPSCLLGDYSSGIAWKGSDTYGSLMVRYNTSEIRVSGGNGANTNPKWTVDLVHSGNIGSQSVNFANGAEIANYANSAGSANSVAWGNVTDKPSTFPATVDSSLSSTSNNPVKNSAIYSAFSNAVGFDHDKYGFGDNGSWRLQEYFSTGNSLDIRYGKININAQEKTYSVSFGSGKSFTNTNYTIVFGIYRDNRNSWFWSPLVKTRDKTGFTVYVRGNTSGDNSGILMYIAIRSN